MWQRRNKIVNSEGRRTHQVICSNGTVRSNYACESCGRRQTCSSKTFVPCCDDAFDEDVIHLVHPGSAGCDGAFEFLQMRSRVDSPGRKPIKSGSQSTTAVEQTTYNNMSEKTVNTPILQPCIASEGSFPNARVARKNFPLTPTDEATMTSVMEKVHEYEKCHCVRPKTS